MDHTKSSYEFHLHLEHPLAFCRREWKAIALFGGGFCLVMLAGILAVDPAFFYPRLQTDPLLYYLKAKSLVETGSTAARAAVNVPPFPYAAMPGVLRAPFIAAFSEFDDQLRAMQIFNVPLVATVALMSAYIASWVLPRERHSLVIAFAFAFTLLSPVWVANVFSPLADAPYAAFSLAAVIVAIRIITSPQPRRAWSAIALFAVLFTIAFMLRFTAPVILVFAAVLARGRWGGVMTARQKVLVIAAPLVLLLLLVSFNLQAIFGRYFFEPLGFLAYGDKPGMLVNLLAVALPSQVVPSFHLGFLHPPIDNIYGTTFASTRSDAAWLVVGLMISAVVITGMIRSRDRFLPEIWYVVSPLPILTLMLPSTTRYLMSYQPFIWIFFYVGMAHLAARYARRLPPLLRSRAFILATGLIVIAIAGGLRWRRVAGSASEPVMAVGVTQAPGYVREVASTFRGLRGFIESLPRESTLLVGGRGTVGRWTVIAGRDYYMPDSLLTAVARQKSVYLLAECGTREKCQNWDDWKKELEKRVTDYGDFEFDSVYAIESPRARAEVFRVRSVP